LTVPDHQLLEDVIRKSVTPLVASAHPEHGVVTDFGDLSQQASPDGTVNDGIDYNVEPERNPDFMALPGAALALSYRQMLDDCLVSFDPEAIRRLTSILQETGVPLYTLSVMLFTPVAARFGQRWCDDESDFIQVAVASTRLSMMVHHLMHAKPAWQKDRPHRRVLLAKSPGMQHTIGILIVAACFRDLGWQVDGGSELEVGEALFGRLTASRYSMVGLSVGSVGDVGLCAETILGIRSRHRSGKILVAVGGPGIVRHRDAFQKVGADIVAANAVEAVRLAESLVV
jgi:methanogenic corrinoid protein MtbC1